MVGGLPAGYEYLRSLGVAKTNITTLQNKWNDLMFKVDPVIRNEAEEHIKDYKLLEVETMISYEFKNKELLL